ncbi:MAG: NAD-glutamate dehydrogenase domain-containing protein [Actinomycetes bacterium]
MSDDGPPTHDQGVPAPGVHPDVRTALRDLLLGALPLATHSRFDTDRADAAAEAALIVLQRRQPGEVIIATEQYLDPLDTALHADARTAIEVAADDRSLLFSTVLAAVRASGVTPLQWVHPIISVERSDDQIVAVGPPAGDGTDASFIHVALREALTDTQREDLEHNVRSAIDELVAVETASDELAAAVAAAADRLEAAGRSDALWSDAAAFARWLRRRHFILMGAWLPDGRTLGVGTDADQVVVPSGPVTVRRSARTSRVHRSERTAVISFADPDGGPPTQVVGLTTVEGRSERPSGVPWVRRKLDGVLQRLQVVPSSHLETAIRAMFDDLPWDVLLIADEDWLTEFLSAAVRAAESSTTVLRVLPEPSARAVTLVAAVPQDQYRPTLDDDLAAMLRSRLDVDAVESHTELGQSGMATAAVTALLRTPIPNEADLAALAETATRTARSWPEQVIDALAATTSPERAAHYWNAWGERLPAVYREATPPSVAADDLVALDGVRGTGGLHVRLLPFAPEAESAATLRIAVDGPPPQLSDLVPAIESHGLTTVEESTFDLPGTGDRATVLSVVVERPDGLEVADEGGRLTESLAATWDGHVDPDRLNSLIVGAGLNTEQVRVLRAYVRYLRQLDLSVRLETAIDALAENPAVAGALWEHFAQRFEPNEPTESTPAGIDSDGRDLVLRRCDDVLRLDHDRLLRSLVGLVDATVRTNVWAAAAGPCVVLKFDGALLGGHNLHPAWRELWVSGTDVEGIHLRAGPIARGGLRWSDRVDGVRTEVHQLMEAQRLKNSLIVPTGAKGGFVVRHRTTAPAELRAAVEAAYRVFVEALLEVTDNLVDGEVRRPAGVRAADGDDPYLVVAADRGTATFSDVANGIAADRDFWLGDAFASGGSSGYDHKALGVTARGAWVSVTEHFAQRGVDVQSDPITVVGIGDMSGDVFGNGLLRSRAVRLVAAFDHRHVFIDPDPDPDRSFDERQRLFELPRSSWGDVDRATLSAGAIVHDRTTKHASLTTEVRALLGIDTATLDTPALVRAVLSMEADLIYLGGIGTFVRASDEADDDVGDPANRETRITALGVRSSVVGEGANLGVTPRGRVELAAHGVALNADAVDNSAGVDTSDHEVNLKILLGLAERAGRITRAERDDLLRSVADEVVAAVLTHVANQNRGLTRAVGASQGDLDAHVAVMVDLIRDGSIDPHSHALPTVPIVDQRRSDGVGLYRPELAVIVAAEKVRLTEVALASDLPDRQELHALAVDYVPEGLRAIAGDLLVDHPLRRELVATRLVNEVVDRMGVTWVHETSRTTRRATSEVLGAYWMARSTADIGAWWNAIDDAPVDQRDVLWDPAAALVGSIAEDYLHREVASSWHWPAVARNAAAARVLAHWRPDEGLGGPDAARPGTDPASRAEDLRRMALAPGLAEVADATARDPEDAVDAFVGAGERFGVTALAQAVDACRVPPDDEWAPQLQMHLLLDLDRLRRAAARLLLSRIDHTEIDDALAAIRPRVQAAVEAADTSITPLASVVAELWLVVERLGGPVPGA